jgi:uncharacterized protein
LAKTFLQAEWRKLIMANYETDPEIIRPFLPSKTEIDLWNNTCYLSLVGFMFLNTKVKGIKFPFHTNFEEVNLRFYVRYKDNHEWKRGVVFIREIVPRSALTFIANTVYKENYETMTMSHNWDSNNGMQTVEYKWEKENIWNILKVNAGTELIDISKGSEEEFITEHFWGYTKINGEKTSEYGVEHPRWQVYDIKDFVIDVDFKSVYGQDFEFLNSLKPISVFLAEGSEIKVKSGRII